MHAAWVSFATNGDPGWPQYDLRRRAAMRFNTTSQVVDDPRSWERALWEGIRWLAGPVTLAGNVPRRQPTTKPVCLKQGCR